VSVLALAEAFGAALIDELVPVCAARFAVFSVLFTAPFAVFPAPFTAPVAVLAAPLTIASLLALPPAETLAPGVPALALPPALTSAFFVAPWAAFVASLAAPFAEFWAVEVAEPVVSSAFFVVSETAPVADGVAGVVASRLPLALPMVLAASDAPENRIALPRRSAAAPLRNVMFIVSSFR